MRVYENKLYQEDVSYAAKLNLPWERLQNSMIILSGATGLIGNVSHGMPSICLGT